MLVYDILNFELITTVKTKFLWIVFSTLYKQGNEISNVGGHAE